MIRDQQGRHLSQAQYHTTLRMYQLLGTAFSQQQPWLLWVSFLGRSFQLVLSRDKGASSLVLLSRFNRIWFIFLFTCFQDKENVAEGATSLSSISVSKLLVTCPHFTPSAKTSSERSIPHYALSTFTILLQHSFSLKLGRSQFSVHCYPSCANLYTRTVNVEPQSSFRIPILGEVVQMGAPKLPIMTGRL